jgi:hypothetical protein
LAAGGRQGARDALRHYWRRVAEIASSGIFRASASDKANSDFGLEHSPGFLFVETMTFFASPYQMNPLNYNPVRDLLAEAVTRTPATGGQAVYLRDQRADGKGEDLYRQGTWRRADTRFGVPAADDACRRGRWRILLGRQLGGESGDLSAVLRLPGA